MLKICTFGDFDIKRDGESILNNANYPYRLIKLFKYLLTFRDKKLTPERIIDDLWSEEYFIDPKKVLRTQISRLRKGIKTGDGDQVFFEIVFSYGYYIFHLNNEEVLLDVDIFEKAIEKGNRLVEENLKEAISEYKEALSMYKGEYLIENDYEEWLIPIRNRYERLYLQTLFRVIELLNKLEDYIQIIETCEEAMHLAPLNENLNIYFIEALINIGEKEYALNHYEYITSKLYREMNNMPSQEMKRLYKRLTTDELIDDSIEITDIDKELKSILEKEGALLCDSEHFTFLYNIEKRRNERALEKKGFIGTITMKVFQPSNSWNNSLINPMNDLENIMFSLLRRGDVFSIWNANQIVFVLSNIEYQNINLVKERIINKFNLINKNPNIYIEINIKPI